VQFIPQYVPYLQEAQYQAGAILGVNPYGVARETYVMNLTVLAFLSMIIKALHDKGVVLDAEWQTRLQQITAGTWPPDMLNGVDPHEPPPVV
jgi:hypothetical protein